MTIVHPFQNEAPAIYWVATSSPMDLLNGNPMASLSSGVRYIKCIPNSKICVGSRAEIIDEHVRRSGQSGIREITSGSPRMRYGPVQLAMNSLSGKEIMVVFDQGKMEYGIKIAGGSIVSILESKIETYP
jgi:hypothetical protein